MPETAAAAPTAAPSADHATDCDVLVVGGGINGCGVARDLAGRGWRVTLAEQHDLASHTSSSSTKLIHGGLRYLEYNEFGLVRKALQEREVLLRSAPHIMWPLRFVMPHDASMRPAWLIRLGLFLYDHLAKREVLPASTGLDLRQHAAGQALHTRYTKGFAYSDGWVDDARLVVLNAIDARIRGATILTRTRVTTAQRSATHWVATLQGHQGAQTVRARALVNAAGPWAEHFLRGVAIPASGEVLAHQNLRLVKGSHIVVPRCFEHDHAYIFQNPDKRIIFAIPYEDKYTLIGTTDCEITGDPALATISPEEVRYLCDQASRYFKQAVRPDQVVWTYTGVRPLLDDASGDPAAVTRDYLLESDQTAAPLLTVWGGKITTFRRLAEEAATEIGRLLDQQKPVWTHNVQLPGGDLQPWAQSTGRPDHDFATFVGAFSQQHPWLPWAITQRWARAYGSRVNQVLNGAQQLADLGAEVVPGLYEAELRYLHQNEWALCADDVLWRRSKLALHLSPEQREQVGLWCDTSWGTIPTPHR